MIKSLTTCIFLFLAHILVCQQDTATYSIDIDSVYITASASAGRIVNTLKAETLHLNPIQNISAAINEVPGVYMHTGTLNTNRITIRGIGNRSLYATTKLRAYIDDIPLTNGVGETTIEDFDPEMFRSVDVYKGPGATAYGSGLGGLMLLHTRNRPEGNYLKTKLTLGEYGFVKTNQIFNYQNDQFRIKLLQGYQHTDGYRQNNAYDNRNYSMLLGVNRGKHQFSFLLHSININAQIPSSLNRTDYENQPNVAAANWARVHGYEDYTKTIAGLSYSTSAFDNLYWKSTVFANFYQGYESRPFNILDDEAVFYGLRSSLAYEFENFNNASAQVGFELSQEDYTWNLFRTNDGIQAEQFQQDAEVRTNAQVYAQYNMNVSSKLSLELGINTNLTSYDLDNQYLQDSTDVKVDYQYDGIYSPRCNLRYAIDDTDYFYALISHGFNIPTLEETLDSSGVINKQIKPEVGWNTEVGYIGKSNNKRWSYIITAYHMSVRDLLVARRTSADQFIGVNAGGSRHMGAELAMSYDMSLPQSWKSNFSLAYTYQYFKFSDFVDGDEDYSGNKLTGAIPQQIALDWNAKYKNLGLTVKYKYFDGMPMTDDNSIYSEAYSLVDVYVGFQQKIRNFNIQVNAGINNMFDTKYASMILVNAGNFGNNAPRYYYPGLPINLFLQTSVQYSF